MHDHSNTVLNELRRPKLSLIYIYVKMVEKLCDVVSNTPFSCPGVFEELEQVKSRNMAMAYDHDRSNPMYHQQHHTPPQPPRHHPYQDNRRSYDHSPAPSSGGRSHRDDR